MNKSTFYLVASPSIGPAVVTVLGINIPIVAAVLSLVSLLLARSVALPSKRTLTRAQDYSVTAALSILLFAIVCGEMIIPQPGVGMAVVWGLGLGLSGLLIIEICAEFVVAFFKAFLSAIRNPSQD